MLLIPVASAHDPSDLAADDRRAALGALPLAVAYTLMLVVAVRLARRFPLDAAFGGRTLAVHGGAAVAFGLTLSIIERLVAPWSPAAASFSLPIAVALNASVYALLAGGAHAVEYLRRYRHTEAAELRLRAELNEAAKRRAEAELRVLKAELNPHFLGNALHVVATLTRTDPDGAVRLLAQLDALLRSAVEHAHTQQVTLDEELTQLEPFLSIEQARLGGALDVVWDVAPDVRAARVPHLLLQPLVENAVRHGLAPRGGERGRIVVAARRVTAGGDATLLRDHLELTVTDDGIGLAPTGDRRAARGVGMGVGLANGRARLAELYGAAATLTLAQAEGGGTVARVLLPWNDAPGSDGPAADATPAGSATGVADAPLGTDHDVDDVVDDAARRPGGTIASRRTAAPRRGRVARFALPLWFSGVWLLWTRTSYELPLEDGRTTSLPSAAIEGLVMAVLWTTILLTAIRLTRRAPLAGRHAARHLLYHIAAAVALAGVVVVSKLLVSWAFGYPLPDALVERRLAAGVATMSFYALLTAAAHAVEYARRYGRTEAARLLLRDRLAGAARRRAEAELHALKTELNPQLLGSTVRTAASLVSTDPDGAVRVLAHLGTMVRDALLRTRVQEVTLEEEMAGLEPFLEVTRTPAAAHPAIEWDVAPTTLGARVPHLILQPLLAGALRHAAGTSARIRVVARRSGTRLEVAVELADGDRNGTGASSRTTLDLRATSDDDPGVTNARARLAELYGGDADLTFESPHGGTATVARLVLPFVDDADESYADEPSAR